jgi:hypothetical protein
MDMTGLETSGCYTCSRRLQPTYSRYSRKFALFARVDLVDFIRLIRRLIDL